MKIDFFGDHKVKITFELKTQYKCKLEHRKIIGNAQIIKEFSKIHPDKNIIDVIAGCKINNFSKTGTVCGEWVFQLERPKSPAPPKKKTQTSRKPNSRKKKTSLK
jgi:hypothetical protein